MFKLYQIFTIASKRAAITTIVARKLYMIPFTLLPIRRFWPQFNYHFCLENKRKYITHFLARKCFWLLENFIKIFDREINRFEYFSKPTLVHYCLSFFSASSTIKGRKIWNSDDFWYFLIWFYVEPSIPLSDPNGSDYKPLLAFTSLCKPTLACTSLYESILKVW